MKAPSVVLGANVSQGNDANALQNILAPAFNIAIWERSVAPMRGALKALVDVDISLKVSGTPDEVLKAWQAHFAELGLQNSAVLTDIKMLLDTFQSITKAKSFRVLLSTVHTNMCKLFHTDVNDLRMLCTYWGQGTMWAAEASHDRNAMLIQGEDGHVGPHPDSIRQANSGDVLILKGALYPNGEAVMHKSPLIEEEGGVRLLLRIDTNERLFD